MIDQQQQRDTADERATLAELVAEGAAERAAEQGHTEPHLNAEGGCRCSCPECKRRRPGRAYALCICTACGETCRTDRLEQDPDEVPVSTACC